MQNKKIAYNKYNKINSPLKNQNNNQNENQIKN